MSKPNVIVIQPDQLKATASHLYGNTFCKTPQLERLAHEGILYENAYTPHPLCVPARQSLWTAQYSSAHGSRDNQRLMPADATHAFKIWKEAGFTTGLIGKNHCFETEDDLDLFDVWCEINHNGLPQNGVAKGMDWFRPIESINLANKERDEIENQCPAFGYNISDWPLEDYSTGLVAGQTVRFLEKHRDDPFALWVSIPDPHEPWAISKKYADQFPPDAIDLPPWPDDECDDATPLRNRILNAMTSVRDDDPQEVYGLLSVYYGMVKFIDDALGQILDALERFGLRENTIVVFCSDHGDFAGEHGMVRKGGVFYDCLTKIPLILSAPGLLPQDARDDSMANLVDIVPTLLHLQGLEIPDSMQGEPLPSASHFKPRAYAFSEYGKGGPAFTFSDLEKFPKPYGSNALLNTLKEREAEGLRKMVCSKEWKYVHDPMGDRDELYHLASDPWELKNLADESSHTAKQSELRSILASWSSETAPKRAPKQ